MNDKITEIRVCPHHGETEFRLYIQNNRERWRCLKCQSEATQKRREKIKDMAIEYKGGKCCLCGYNKCVSALEFHHIDPEQKDFSISTKGYTKAWEDVRNELNKCILVCANCHREIHEAYHNNTLDIEALKQYNISIENENTKILDKKPEYYCVKCGVNKVSEKGNKCVECSRKDRRKVERPTREELKNLIRTVSFKEIGRQYGVADNTIKKWCKAYDLPNKTKDIKTYSDEEWKII